MRRWSSSVSIMTSVGGKGATVPRLAPFGLAEPIDEGDANPGSTLAARGGGDANMVSSSTGCRDENLNAAADRTRGFTIGASSSGSFSFFGEPSVRTRRTTGGARGAGEGDTKSDSTSSSSKPGVALRGREGVGEGGSGRATDRRRGGAMGGGMSIWGGDTALVVMACAGGVLKLRCGTSGGEECVGASCSSWMA